MDSEKQRKSDRIEEAANGQAPVVESRKTKRLDKGRRVTIDTSNGPIVLDLPTEGQVTYVPFTVPAGVAVRFEDIEVGK